MNEELECGVHWTRGLEHCPSRRWMDFYDNEYFIASFTIALTSGGAHYIINRNFKPTPVLVQLGLHKLVWMWCGKNSSPALIGGAMLSVSESLRCPRSVPKSK